MVGYFTGSGTDGLDLSQAREVDAIVDRLANGDPAKHRYLWSAASYLCRCGEPLTDEAVKAEASRRREHFNAAMRRNEAKRKRWAEEAT